MEKSNLEMLDKFVILVYDGSSFTANLNESKLDKFAKKGLMEPLHPPNNSAPTHQKCCLPGYSYVGSGNPMSARSRALLTRDGSGLVKNGSSLNKQLAQCQKLPTTEQALL